MTAPLTFCAAPSSGKAARGSLRCYRVPSHSWTPKCVRKGRLMIEHGPAGITQVGPRAYVGGLWEEIGRLQFDFLVAQGLRPHHVLLDIGCGCLRGGVHFVRYLEQGHYLGMDKEPLLIEAGIRDELGPAVCNEKAPELLVSESFEFERFSRHPDFALAQSLFTHLPDSLIQHCLMSLRAVITSHGAFYATFFETHDPEHVNPTVPNDWGYFAYTRAQMAELGRRTGWRAEYVGEWGHARGQRMMRYVPHEHPALASQTFPTPATHTP